jgi:cell division septation protein DedD
MPDRAIVVLIIAAVALVLLFVIINANTVIRIRRPRYDQEGAYLSEPLPADARRSRVVRTVRRTVRPRRAGSRSVVQSSADEYYAEPDPRYTGPPPIDPWYARGWRGRIRRRAGLSAPLPVEEVVEEAPVDADDGTGTETQTAVPEPRVEHHTEVVDEHDRLI